MRRKTWRKVRSEHGPSPHRAASGPALSWPGKVIPKVTLTQVWRRSGRDDSMRREPIGRRLHILLRSALESEEVPVALSFQEERTKAGFSSRIPKCAPVPSIRIQSRNERRCGGVWTVTSSTHTPAANARGLPMTKPSDSPACRPWRIRTQSESSRPERHASNHPTTRSLPIPEFVRDPVSSLPGSPMNSHFLP